MAVTDFWNVYRYTPGDTNWAEFVVPADCFSIAIQTDTAFYLSPVTGATTHFWTVAANRPESIDTRHLIGQSIFYKDTDGSGSIEFRVMLGLGS